MKGKWKNISEYVNNLFIANSKSKRIQAIIEYQYSDIYTLNALSKKKIDVNPLITQKVNLTNYLEIYNLKTQPSQPKFLSEYEINKLKIN